jgi:hypothetical protein
VRVAAAKAEEPECSGPADRQAAARRITALDLNKGELG